MSMHDGFSLYDRMTITQVLTPYEPGVERIPDPQYHTEMGYKFIPLPGEFNIAYDALGLFRDSPGVQARQDWNTPIDERNPIVTIEAPNDEPPADLDCPRAWYGPLTLEQNDTVTETAALMNLGGQALDNLLIVVYPKIRRMRKKAAASTIALARLYSDRSVIPTSDGLGTELTAVISEETRDVNIAGLMMEQDIEQFTTPMPPIEDEIRPEPDRRHNRLPRKRFTVAACIAAVAVAATFWAVGNDSRRVPSLHAGALPTRASAPRVVTPSSQPPRQIGIPAPTPIASIKPVAAETPIPKPSVTPPPSARVITTSPETAPTSPAPTLESTTPEGTPSPTDSGSPSSEPTPTPTPSASPSGFESPSPTASSSGTTITDGSSPSPSPSVS